jgi:hypothetical protein
VEVILELEVLVVVMELHQKELDLLQLTPQVVVEVVVETTTLVEMEVMVS